MAEYLISPGTLARENDQSQITSQPIQAGATIIGPAVKGPVGIPTLVTTYSQYANLFGTTFVSSSQVYSFFTSISAYNYFNNGGDSLLVTRITEADYLPATSSYVATGSETASATGAVFELTTFSKGIIMNSSCSEVTGSLVDSGSVDNLRWEIPTSDTASGVFSLLLRRGNDTTNQKVVLESWNNLSLDPKADNYIAKVIGDSYKAIDTSDTNPYVKTIGNYPNSSNFVYVSKVNKKTPDYFDNNGVAKSVYTGSIPTTQSGSFGGASGSLVTSAMTMYENITASSNIQGLNESRYTSSIALLANKDEYQFNLITAPGLLTGVSTGVINTLITMVQERGDALTIVDPGIYGSTLLTLINNVGSYNTSYAAAYAPWLQTTDPDSGQLVWVPASVMVPGIYAYNDKVGEPWFAPAGLNRGVLSNVSRLERKLQQPDRDLLYKANINSISSFPNVGVAAFGQKTLQKKASALDRVNVRRLLIALKSYISQIANKLVFEQNTIATRNSFLSKVNPYLESVQQRQGLYAFKVIMDESINGPEILDREELRGQIFLQPTKTAEYILLDFNVMPSGVSFS